MNSVAVIVVAGGSGSRMGSTLPKQFLSLAGQPVLMHTLSRFADALPESELIVVLPEAQIETWQTLCRQHGFTVVHRICIGGATRFESVKNGLALAQESQWVVVHDGVRPLVRRTTILDTLHAAQHSGAAIPVVVPIDSLRQMEGERSHIVDRALFRSVQTPQIFSTELLLAAYGQPYQPRFTDDASVVEASGHPITLCAGAYDNLKITTPTDLIVAEQLLRHAHERSDETSGSCRHKA